MSFLKKLFGGGGDSNGGEKELGRDSYKEYSIHAMEMRVGSEYQLCGEVRFLDGEEEKVHRYIRADRFSSADQASDVTISKGRQIIDEQGKSLFG